jgi:hypothetical protein
MISETTAEFRKRLRALPGPIRIQARQIYQRWQLDPRHPSLQFKRIHSHEPIYSVRIGIHWRAVCVLDGNIALWFWIGSHAEYDVLIKHMRRR